jgi:lactoylglutathione lyase
MMIKEANVTLMVRDIDESVAFYTRTLGLRLKNRYGDHFAQVEAPGTIISLHPKASEDGQKPGKGNLSLGFSVANLDDAVADLKAKGVKFSELKDDSQVRLAFFEDPDGYPLYLSQSKWG